MSNAETIIEPVMTALNISEQRVSRICQPGYEEQMVKNVTEAMVLAQSLSHRIKQAPEEALVTHWIHMNRAHSLLG